MFLEGTDLVMIIGSFGASAVLVYGAVRSPLAQPRNLMGGHMISAVIGVASYQFLHAHLWLAAAVAVATAIAVMHGTKTLHPPGGATSLIAVIGSDKIHTLGYLYVWVPRSCRRPGHARHRPSREQYSQKPKVSGILGMIVEPIDFSLEAVSYFSCRP